MDIPLASVQNKPQRPTSIGSTTLGTYRDTFSEMSCYRFPSYRRVLQERYPTLFLYKCYVSATYQLN